MTEKQFHLKIKWKNREKTEAIEIVLYDGGQPLCELISVDDARLVRDVLNEQEERIQELETRNKRQYERLKNIGDLMFKRDWETLGLIVDKWEKEEEQLRKYGG